LRRARIALMHRYHVAQILSIDVDTELFMRFADDGIKHRFPSLIQVPGRMGMPPAVRPAGAFPPA